MACLSGMFRRKKKAKDVELKSLNEKYKYDSDDESKPKPYSLNKDLIPNEPSAINFVIKPEEFVDLENSDLEMLQDKKTFTDYFYAGDVQYIEKSGLVQERETEFKRLLEMESEENWELKMEKDFLKVFIKMDEDVPIVKALFNMQVEADPQVLYDLLYNVSARTAWDSSVIEYQELSQLDKDTVVYYMLNKAPWPFNNRDFVEVRYTRRTANGDIEIFYKETEWDHSGTPGAERGRTLFAGQILRKTSTPQGKTLLVTLISQAVFSGKIPPKALKETLPISLLNWYKTVRKELLKTSPESCINL